MAKLADQKQQEKDTAVKNATLFFQDIAKKQAPNLKPLKVNEDKTAILVDKSDKDLYDWALNG